MNWQWIFINMVIANESKTTNFRWSVCISMRLLRLRCVEKILPSDWGSLSLTRHNSIYWLVLGFYRCFHISTICLSHYLFLDARNSFTVSRMFLQLGFSIVSSVSTDISSERWPHKIHFGFMTHHTPVTSCSKVMMNFLWVVWHCA